MYGPARTDTFTHAYPLTEPFTDSYTNSHANAYTNSDSYANSNTVAHAILPAWSGIYRDGLSEYRPVGGHPDFGYGVEWSAYCTRRYYGD